MSGSAHHVRAQASHLLFQEADGVRERSAAERVRAHELAKILADRGRSAGRRFLLEQPHANAAFGEAQRRF
jgi:hypothetical protein